MAAVLAEHRPSTLYHLAAESHVDRSIDTPLGFVETNILGTATLLAAALDYWRGLDAIGRKEFRFLQVSTDEVYGELGPTGSFDDTSRLPPQLAICGEQSRRRTSRAGLAPHLRVAGLGLELFE